MMAEKSAQPSPPLLLRFSVFEADLRSGELRKKGSLQRLSAKPFQVLAALLEKPGEVVSREELRHRLWPETTFVDFDNNLNAAVGKLRQALGDSAESPRFVETLPRRGYRFLASVERLPPFPDPVPTQPTETAAPFKFKGGLWLALGALAVVLTVALGWIVGAGDDPPPSAKGTSRAMLAVLPFTNLDPDPQREFFCDGLTEELIAQLGRLDPKHLGVIARTSSNLYKNTEKSIEEIGRDLAVDLVIEGSVRSAEGRTRITVQLIEVSDQTHLWSETYDTPLADLLEVQGEVAVQVATILALELLPDEPLARARSSTRITGAYEEFLRGRQEWNRFSKEGYLRAISHFERALDLDPGYAAAWAGLANAYNLRAFSPDILPREVFPLALEAAETALTYDSHSAEAYAARGFAHLYFEYDLAAADLDFRRALELRPNFAMAHHWHAGALSALERHDEAIAAMQRAKELDPLSLSVLSDAGWYYLFAQRPDSAIDECRRTLEIQNYGWAQACLFHAYLSSGRTREAHERLPFIISARPTVDESWYRVLALQDPAAALAAAQRLWLEEDRAREGAESPYPVNRAFLEAAVGDLDAAFLSLERGLEIRDAWMVFLHVDPRFAPLRQDPRYGELARRVGLPSKKP